MKRGYLVTGFDDMYGVAVVASNVREAKKLAFNSGYFTDEDWTDIKSRWVRGADVSGMSSGVVPSLGEGLERGFYAFIDGICERCGFEERLELFHGAAFCIACILELGGEVK